jgi:hypothetical protein
MVKDLFTNYFHIPKQQPGWPLLAIAGGLAVILCALYLPAGLIGFSGFIYLHIILHSPRRTISKLPSGRIAAPIDGQILWVHRDKASARITVRVRADWLNSHITYAPMAGQIDQIIWYDGQFTGFADDALPPPENARQEIALTPLHSASSEDKITICHHGAPLSRVLQSCVQEGRKVSPEMPIALGLLRPKIDISFPASYGLDIYAGQRCLAGETIIAKKEV